MIDISIIIVNYNVKEYIIPCIQSIFQHCSHSLSVEIIVVDNNSQDGSVNALETKFPEITILKNKNNKKLNISFVTKKKQIKSAVKRNKVKRRLRNIMNDLVKKISINFNLSYLVMAKTTMLNNDYQVIKETLFQDFKKIK